MVELSITVNSCRPSIKKKSKNYMVGPAAYQLTAKGTDVLLIQMYVC